jgi:uncharacterized damage-inducible protein DinB
MQRLFAYEAWANTESQASAERLADPPAAAVRWLAHLAGAGAEWRARLTGTHSRLSVWPALSLPECAMELKREAAEWPTYLARLDDAERSRVVVYRNSKGEEHRSTVEDILTHVLLHASYHRGQIASAIRAAGGTPAYTDFIHPTRTGIL